MKWNCAPDRIPAGQRGEERPRPITAAVVHDDKLAAQPPASVRISKALLKAGNAAAIEHAMREEGKHFVERLTSGEATSTTVSTSASTFHTAFELRPTSSTTLPAVTTRWMTALSPR